ncbi:MAG TPA: hypothetical protein VMQ62_03360 [Dongiaceae bacterium]|nr:hypothetical protein [Dongiaceae bacterium]
MNRRPPTHPRLSLSLLLAAALAAPAAAAPKPDAIPEAALLPGPSALLAAVPALTAIPRVEECEIADLRRSIDREVDSALARQAADDGAAATPAGAATPAAKRVLDAAASLEGDCLDALDMDATMRRTVDPELDGLRADLRRVSEDFRSALAACPSDPEGGKSAGCTRALYARANVRGFGAANVHLKTADEAFAEGVRRATACLEKRERLVRDGMAAGITGPGVRTVLAPLARAWAVPPLVAERYTAICRSVKEALQSDIPKPR